MSPVLELPAKGAAGLPGRWQPEQSNRILVVEGESTIHHLSARMLVRSGYQVDTADDGQAGWEALHAADYDLLLTDNHMPKLSGLELVRKLRSAQMTLPVVLVSGHLEVEELD